MQKIVSSPLLSSFSEIVNGTSTKTFGQLSFTYEKDPNRVIMDRTHFLESAGLDTTYPTIVGEQRHTSNIIHITNKEIGQGFLDQALRIPDTDGMITSLHDTHLIVYTADCMALSFYDPREKVIGIAHSGWRGTVSDIGVKMIEQMCRVYGSKAENIHVSVGPSIGPCCYEVKNQEQIDIFQKKYHNIRTRDGLKFVDLWDSIEQDMMRAGILREHFENMKLCTCCHNDIFASYRKDNPNMTLNLSVISMRS